jgi:hypothetical protein
MKELVTPLDITQNQASANVADSLEESDNGIEAKTHVGRTCAVAV